MKSSDKKLELTLVTEPDLFFRDEITRAFKKQKIKEDAEIEHYLVDLMRRFMFSENFFKPDENGNHRQETLAILLDQAIHAPDPGKKCEEFRRLGDISLYTAGFFSDSLNLKTVDVDYYIGMGSNAYSNLSSMMTDKMFRKIYHTLSNKFVRFVDVLSEISANTFKTDSNLLRMYELWIKTGSERVEKNLKEAGIIPNKKIKSNVQ